MFPAPGPEDGDVRYLVDGAICSLGRGDEQCVVSSISDVDVEWMGYWPETSLEEMPLVSTCTEREKFEYINKHVKNEVTIVYVYGGSF